MINKNKAINLMIGLLTLVILFHLSILFEIVSYKIVWAGKISSREEMYIFETISISLNALLITILKLKSKSIKNNSPNQIVNIIIWVFVFLFALNTVGNLFATSIIEMVLGTSLTLFSSVTCWIIVKKEK